MQIEPGMWVVFAAIAFFYIRLIQIRGKRMRERRQQQLELSKRQNKNKPPTPPAPAPTYQVASWWLLGIGALGMLLGLGLQYADGFLPAVQPYWWVLLAVGVVVFAFGLK